MSRLKRPLFGVVWNLGEGGDSSVVVLGSKLQIGPWFKITRSVAKSNRVAEYIVAAIRDISCSFLDPNGFTVVNCIVKGHASLSPPSLRLRLCSRFTLLATYTYFDPKDFSPHPSTVLKVKRLFSPFSQASLSSTKSKEQNKTKKKHRFTK
ncbi:hypothetical protein TNCV_888001 [Trichonephila clavipes]|nr:hypothetical protein TNCV_888001 [Trichonephila clavipes]